MYGTRDASLQWEDEYVRFMTKVGFMRGLSSPCQCNHPGTDFRAAVYREDFMLFGAEYHLDWYKQQIMEVYELDLKARLRPQEGDTKTVRVLNIFLEWKHDGIYMEADPRHAEILIQQLDLGDTVPLAAPNERLNPQQLADEDMKELDNQDASLCGTIVPRGNYLSTDRSDIRYEVEELARRMEKLRDVAYRRLIHFGRYLRGQERVVSKGGYQKNCNIIDVWSDTDRAGCLERCKYTNGGVIVCGSHVIKHWSGTQALSALSSGEAEFYGCVRVGSHGLGLKSILSDLGVTGKRLRINTDAVVAKSLASRRGIGGIRHIEVNQLWLQDKVNNGEIEIEKIMGIINRADALTTPKDGSSTQQHLGWTSQEITRGRHD